MKMLWLKQKSVFWNETLKIHIKTNKNVTITSFHILHRDFKFYNCVIFFHDQRLFTMRNENRPIDDVMMTSYFFSIFFSNFLKVLKPYQKEF